MFTATFTDPQGLTHTDAVFKLHTANRNKHSNSNEYEHYELSHDDFTTVTNPEPQVNNDSSHTVNYQFYYWTNQAAIDAGKAPYILANMSNNSMSFRFTPDETYDALTLEEKCEKHVQEVILPTML